MFLVLLFACLSVGANCQTPTAAPTAAPTTITNLPGLCDGRYLNVSLDLDFLGLIRVDSSLQQVEYNLILQLSWLDTSLSWDPGPSGITTKYRLPKDICFPDLVIEGSISSTLQGISSGSSSREVAISHQGRVTVYHPFIYTGFCPMRLFHFPFDTQWCRMKIFSPTRGIGDMDLYSVDADWIEEALISEEWIVAPEIGTSRTVSSSTLDNQQVTVITYVFTMSRRCGFYLLHLSLPSTLVAFVATLGFFTPHATDDKRQEKTRLGMSAMLALAVQMMIVARSLPVTGDTPVLTRYNVILLVIVFVGTLINASTVAIQHQAILYKWPISPCLRGLCFSCLPSMLCMTLPTFLRKSKRNTKCIKVDTAGENHTPSPSARVKEEEKASSKEEWMYLTLVTDRIFLVLMLTLQCIAVGWFCSFITNI